MSRKRNKQFIIRASEEEYQAIKKNIEKSKLNQNEYLLMSALNKKIIVIDGIKELMIQLKKIGNNLNQITKSTHQGKTNYHKELDEINGELSKIWQSLRQLIPKRV